MLNFLEGKRDQPVLLSLDFQDTKFIVLLVYDKNVHDVAECLILLQVNFRIYFYAGLEFVVAHLLRVVDKKYILVPVEVLELVPDNLYDFLGLNAVVIISLNIDVIDTHFNLLVAQLDLNAHHDTLFTGVGARVPLNAVNSIAGCWIVPD